MFVENMACKLGSSMGHGTVPLSMQRSGTYPVQVDPEDSAGQLGVLSRQRYFNAVGQKDFGKVQSKVRGVGSVGQCRNAGVREYVVDRQRFP